MHLGWQDAFPRVAEGAKDHNKYLINNNHHPVNVHNRRSPSLFTIASIVIIEDVKIRTSSFRRGCSIPAVKYYDMGKGKIRSRIEEGCLTWT